MQQFKSSKKSKKSENTALDATQECYMLDFTTLRIVRKPDFAGKDALSGHNTVMRTILQSTSVANL